MCASRPNRAGRKPLLRIAVTGWLGALSWPGAVPPAQAQEDPPKVIVLGFDGADARLTEEYLARGLLPNLARLRESGTYVPLGTTTPPQTPVSWSAFATGWNPGRNGIFDFLRRDPETYQPDFAMYVLGSEPVLLGKNNRFLVAAAALALGLLLGAGLGALRRRVMPGLAVGLLAGAILGAAAVLGARDLIPHQRPTVTNTRAGETFWELAGRAGHRSTIVRVPATFPPDRFDHGRLLSGLGVPDIRGNLGTFSYYTEEALPEQVDENTEMGGKNIRVVFREGEARSFLHGPRHRLFEKPREINPPVTFVLDREAAPPTVTITATGRTQTVALGTWSDWFTLEFRLGALVKAYGIARFYFVSAEPFGLYLSPVNLDPHRPPIPVSTPPRFSRELVDRFGLYKTLGWGMDTMALNELRIDEDTFLEDVYFTENRFAEMMRGLLDDGEFDLYVHVYELTDRVSHMFWRFLDPEHPAYDAELASRYGNAVQDSYVAMDRMVGEALERIAPRDVLLVCSDHGFHTWHKTANYNTWLVRNGYMTLKNDSPDPQKKLEDLFGQGQFWPNVDWRRTKAYALGLGDIYLNVRGRESQGIVEPGEEYDRIRDRLQRDLEAWIDPETGDHPVRRAMKREDIYRDFDPGLIPDLLVANNPKYRVSWQTSLGGIPKEVLSVNDRKWSGDHCSLDPEITQGILFSNRRLDAEGATILDLFPTVLGYLDVPIPGDLDGRRLLER